MVKITTERAFFLKYPSRRATWEHCLPPAWEIDAPGAMTLDIVLRCCMLPLRYSRTVHVAKLVITAAHHEHFSERFRELYNRHRRSLHVNYLDFYSAADYNWFWFGFLLWLLLLSTASSFSCSFVIIWCIFTPTAILLLAPLLFQLLLPRLLLLSFQPEEAKINATWGSGT